MAFNRFDWSLSGTSGEEIFTNKKTGEKINSVEYNRRKSTDVQPTITSKTETDIGSITDLEDLRKRYKDTTDPKMQDLLTGQYNKNMPKVNIQDLQAGGATPTDIEGNAISVSPFIPPPRLQKIQPMMQDRSAFNKAVADKESKLQEQKAGDTEYYAGRMRSIGEGMATANRDVISRLQKQFPNLKMEGGTALAMAQEMTAPIAEATGKAMSDLEVERENEMNTAMDNLIVLNKGVLDENANVQFAENQRVLTNNWIDQVLNDYTITQFADWNKIVASKDATEAGLESGNTMANIGNIERNAEINTSYNNAVATYLTTAFNTGINYFSKTKTPETNTA